MAKKILVIDDERTFVGMVKTRLEASGYEVVTACDGGEGLKKAEAEKPDLIILDIKMPVMDGYTFVIEFKKNSKINEIPIIVITAKDQLQDIFKIEGVSDYLAKPLDNKKLLDVINKYI